jgi:hypothetical protein
MAYRTERTNNGEYKPPLLLATDLESLRVKETYARMDGWEKEVPVQEVLSS